MTGGLAVEMVSRHPGSHICGGGCVGWAVGIEVEPHYILMFAMPCWDSGIPVCCWVFFEVILQRACRDGCFPRLKEVAAVFGVTR